MLEFLESEAALEELEAFFEERNGINRHCVRARDAFNDAREDLGGVARDVSG
jgi:hypothetical protein